MGETRRRRRRAAIVGVAASVVAAATVPVLLFGLGASASGGPRTFPQVTCTATLSNGAQLSQSQDITLDVEAPDNAVTGATFTDTIKGQATDLPKTGSGIPILAFKNLNTTFSVSGGTVTAVNPSGAPTLDGSPVAGSATHTADTVTIGIPGPITPGHLVPPDVGVDIVAGAAGTTVTVSAVEVDTTVTLGGLGDVSVTCPLLPPNTMAGTAIVGKGETTSTAPTTTSTSTSTTTSTTTPTTIPTTAPPVTSSPTTVGAQQVKVSGKSTDTNTCQSSLVPPLQDPSTQPVAFTISADAFPQPHKGQPITVSNTKVGVSVPAATLQKGVDTGFIKDGDVVPSTLTLVVAGSNTTEGTHTYTVSQDATISVGPPSADHPKGVANPLDATGPLPDTTWHPSNASDAVAFTEQSATIVSKITLSTPTGAPLLVTSTFDCKPSTAPAFLALAAQGAALPVVTTTTAPATPQSAAGTPQAQASAPALPRTGASSLPLTLLGVVLVAAGGALVVSQRRRGWRPLGHR